MEKDTRVRAYAEAVAVAASADRFRDLAVAIRRESIALARLVELDHVATPLVELEQLDDPRAWELREMAKGLVQLARKASDYAAEVDFAAEEAERLELAAAELASDLHNQLTERLRWSHG